jgi:hypothetical protein
VWKGLAIGPEDLVRGGHAAVETFSYQLSAVSFLSKGVALAGKGDLIRQIVAFSRACRQLYLLADR